MSEFVSVLDIMETPPTVRRPPCAMKWPPWTPISGAPWTKASRRRDMKTAQAARSAVHAAADILDKLFA